jgi:hypothetical protein
MKGDNSKAQLEAIGSLSKEKEEIEKKRGQTYVIKKPYKRMRTRSKIDQNHKATRNKSQDKRIKNIQNEDKIIDCQLLPKKPKCAFLYF